MSFVSPSPRRSAHEALLTALALTAGRKESAEVQRSVWLAATESPNLVASFKGKYVALPGGYIHLREGGGGLFLRELPEGATASELAEGALAFGATPLRDRLRVLIPNLRSEGTPADSHFADILDRTLGGCNPQYDRGLVDFIHGRASEVVGLLLREQLDAAVNAASILFMWFGDHLGSTRKEMAGDGALAASLGVLGVLPVELARTGSVSLVGAAGLIANLPPTSIETLARGFCMHAVRREDHESVRAVAETFKRQGDEWIQRALDGPMDEFHISLYQAAAPEMAVSIVASAIGLHLPDGEERRRWARLQINAEERIARIEGSLQWALIDIDRHGYHHYRERIAELNQSEGARAARLVGLDLIENSLLYPRALLPALLGE